MPTVDVYTYQWTLGDFSTDGAVIHTSQHKVTQGYLEQRIRSYTGRKYRLLEDSRETVASILVVDGKYYSSASPVAC